MLIYAQAHVQIWAAPCPIEERGWLGLRTKGQKRNLLPTLCLAFLLGAAILANTGSTPNAQASNGWMQPVPLTSPAAGWLASGCRGSAEYDSGLYHIGRDYWGAVGTPVKAIGSGTVLESANFGEGFAQAVFIRHKAQDGTEFVVLYGHINSGIAKNAAVVPGQEVGTLANIPSGAHLHLGLIPGTAFPSSGWGRMFCSSWPVNGQPATNGFVDPIPFLEAHPAIDSYTPPPTIPWSFENLEGDGGAVSPHSSDVGRAPAAVEFNGQLYVFHYDVHFGDLRYARTSPGWVFDILDGAGGANGRTTSNVGQTPSAVVFNNQLHVFYFDAGVGNLRHAVSGDGVYWIFENLDGDWGSIGGLDGNIGQTPVAVVFETSLQVFYYDASRGNLRHAWWNGQWYFENLEGDFGSISHYDANIGLDPAAVAFSGTLQLFYYDVTLGNLRHSWIDGTGWHFENLDGDYGSVGRLNADVGGHPTAVVYRGDLHVFYYDITNGNFRHMWADAVGWHAENLEGDAGSISHFDGDVGTSSTAVVVGNTLQVFVYEAGRGNLRHLLDDGTGWRWENFDGEGGGPAGRLLANVGHDPVAITFGGGLQLFYYDFEHGDLRHAMPQ